MRSLLIWIPVAKNATGQDTPTRPNFPIPSIGFMIRVVRNQSPSTQGDQCLRNRRRTLQSSRCACLGEETTLEHWEHPDNGGTVQ